MITCSLLVYAVTGKSGRLRQGWRRGERGSGILFVRPGYTWRTIVTLTGADLRLVGEVDTPAEVRAMDPRSMPMIEIRIQESCAIVEDHTTAKGVGP